MKQVTKNLMFSLLMVLTFSTSTAQAWISSSPTVKPFNFKFHMNKDTFTYTQEAPSYEEAFERAAQACYRHFKGGRPISEDRGLDIIDVCANPRSI